MRCARCERRQRKNFGRPPGNRLIQINAAARLPQNWRMAPLSTIEVAAIATIALSLAAIGVVLFSMWAAP
jgi:hypothetical protein